LKPKSTNIDHINLIICLNQPDDVWASKREFRGPIFAQFHNCIETRVFVLNNHYHASSIFLLFKVSYVEI